MTVPTETAVTVVCTLCGGRHPRQESVTVNPPGLSAGLNCLTPDTRRLLGLPAPGDFAIGAVPEPPALQGWDPKPSKLFAVEIAGMPEESRLNEEHFRRALNRMGLAPILRAPYASQNCYTTLEIDGANVTFTFKAYTAAAGRIHIWAEGLTGNPERPDVAGMARLTWVDVNTRHPDYEEAHQRALEFITDRGE